MMRITGGILGGRRVNVHHKSIRPTQDRVREAIFSSIAASIPEARVLDLFAGAGTLGLEAWSRGAGQVDFVEKNGTACFSLRETIEAFDEEGLGLTRCIQMDVWAFLEHAKGHQAYDIILADPPYDRDAERSQLEQLLAALERSPVLAAGGLLVYEQSKQEEPVEREGWTLLRDKTYGDTCVLIYKRV